jgi:hypothetical protein
MANPDSPVSPEKELLKIIEGSDTGQGPQELRADPASPPRGFKMGLPDYQTLLAPETWQNLATNFSNAFKGISQGGRQSISLKRVLSVGKTTMFILTGMLVMNLVYDIFETSRPVEPDQKLAQRKIAEASELMAPVYSTSIATDLERRNVFAPSGKRADRKEGQSDLALKLVEMTKPLRLTGISVHPDLADKTFCMIEDTQKNMTSFLRIGDTILGMKVTKISANGVTLKYQDEEMELK